MKTKFVLFISILFLFPFFAEAVISVHPQSQSVCIGNPVSLTVGATGARGYQWYKDGSPIPGATSQAIATSSYTVDFAGEYYCKVTDAFGFSYSNIAYITTETVSISSQPVDVTVCNGQSATFSITAQHASSYQWLENNVDIPGATSSTCVIDGSNTYTGNTYKCVIASSQGCAVMSSNEAILTVSGGTVISAHPTSDEICEGDSKTLSVTISGSLGTPTYAWYNDGVIETNSNSSTYIADEDAQYYCKITDNCGTVQSNTATLTVKLNPTITSASSSSTEVCLNQDITLSVSGNLGSSNAKWYWYKNTCGSNEVGHTTSLSINETPTIGSTTYYVKGAGGECGTTACKQVSVTVYSNTQNPTITSDVTEICSGTDLVLNVNSSISNSPGTAWTWYKSTDCSGTSIGTGSSITVSPTSNSTYSVRAEGGSCQNNTIDNIAITVNENPTITTQPSLAPVCSGTNPAITVNASGTNLQYQWQQNASGTWNNIGNDNNQLELTNVDETMNDYEYRCIVTGDCGSITSNTTTLEIKSTPVITSQPSNTEICYGNNTNISVSATGSNIEYQWLKNDVEISGGTSNIINFTNANSSMEGTYKCNITNDCNNSVVSDAAILTVNNLPTPNIGNDTIHLCNTNTLTLNPGNFTSYLWDDASTGSTMEVVYSESYSGEETISETNTIAIPDDGCNLDNYIESQIIFSNTNDAIVTKIEVLNLNLTHTYIGDISIKLISPSGTEVVLTEFNGSGADNFININFKDDASTSIDTASTPYSGDYHPTGSLNSLISEIANGTWKIRICDNAGADTGTLDSWQLKIFYNIDGGNREYSIEVTDDNNCTNSDTILVLFNDTIPSIYLGADTSLCLHDTLALAENTTFDSYLWNDNSTETTFDVVSSGIYSVTVSKTGTVCESVDSININVSSPYNGQEICLVTVDTNEHKNLILWDKIYGLGIASYNIYKLEGNEYDLIGNVPFNDQALFIDLASSPNVSFENYKISINDTCGNESVLSPFHETMLLSKVQGQTPQELTLMWNKYVDETGSYIPEYYYIYRGEFENMTLFDSVSGSGTANPVTFNINNAQSEEQFIISINKSPCNVDGNRVMSGPYDVGLSNIEDNIYFDNPSYNLTEEVSICSGSDYTFPDSTTQTGIISQVVYTSNLQTILGNDSIIETTVNISPFYNTSEDISICSGENYTFPDESTQTNITSQTVHTSNMQTALGCDSIIETTVNIRSVDVSVTENGLTLTANATGVAYQWVDCNGNYSAIAGETNQFFIVAENGDYAVIIDNEGCIDTSVCFTVIVAGNLEIGLSNILIYPNPAYNFLMIENLSNANKITITDITGKTVLTNMLQSNFSNKIDISKLNSGTYLIKIVGDKIFRSKFIKE